MSWIGLPDAVAAAAHLLARVEIAGPANAVAPFPVTNDEFTRALSRPAALPVPAFVLRLAFGEMARELLLSGARVVPARLPAGGYRFRHPDLPGALRFLPG